MQADDVGFLSVVKLSARPTFGDHLVAQMAQDRNQLAPLDVARGRFGLDFFDDLVCLWHLVQPRQSGIVTIIQLHHTTNYVENNYNHYLEI